MKVLIERERFWPSADWLYSPQTYGLQAQVDGTWIFKHRLIYPGVLLLNAGGETYKLSSKAGLAAELAVRKIRNPQWDNYIFSALLIWWLAPAFPISEAIRTCMLNNRYWPIVLWLGLNLLLQNIRLVRLANFCKKVGTRAIPLHKIHK